MTTPLSTAQHPELDVADLVTALVKLSVEERINVLVMASHEIGTSYLRDALAAIGTPTLPKADSSGFFRHTENKSLEPSRFWFDEQGNERCDGTCFCARYANAGECIHKALPKALAKIHDEGIIGKVSEK